MIKSIFKKIEATFAASCRIPLANLLPYLFGGAASLTIVGIALIVLHQVQPKLYNQIDQELISLLMILIVSIVIILDKCQKALMRRVAFWPKLTNYIRYIISIFAFYVIFKLGFLVDAAVTVPFVLLCVFTMCAFNLLGRYFSGLQILVRILALTACSYLVYLVSTQIGTCSDSLSGTSSTLNLKSNTDAILLSMLPSLVTKFSCNTLPNIISTMVGILICTFPILYPVFQKGPESSEFHRQVAVHLSTLSNASQGASLSYMLNVPFRLYFLSITGIYLFLLFGIILYTAIPFGPVASTKILSLIILYVGWVSIELFRIDLDTETQMQATPLRFAMHLLLNKKIKEETNNVVLKIDSISLAEKVSEILEEHLSATGVMAKSRGGVNFLPILHGFEYNTDTKLLTVFPLTASFSLPAELTTEFKTLLTKRLSALKSSTHANKLEVHAIFREAVYNDALRILPKFFEDDGTRLAIAAYLTVFAEHLTKRLSIGWCAIAKNLPEKSFTAGELLQHLHVSEESWPLIKEIELESNSFFDTNIDSDQGLIAENISVIKNNANANS